MDKFLGGIERIGNKLPHPFILFIVLSIIVALSSTLLSVFDVTAISPKSNEIVEVRNLISGDGLAFALTSMVENFVNFPPLGLIIVVMFGIGLADKVGLMGSLIHYTVAKAPASLLTFVVFLVGITGSIASDANYLILIPLVALIYHSLGRHPLAGAAAGYAAAGAGYDVSLFVTATDAILSGLTTEAARLVDPTAYISPLDNYYFGAASVFILAIVGTIIIDKIVEPRLKRTIEIDSNHISQPEIKQVTNAEKRGMKYAGITSLGFLVLLLIIVIPEASPLRNEDGGLLPSPLIQSVVPILFIFFMTIGIVYGKTAGTIKSKKEIPDRMAEAVKEMAPTLVIFFIISQFIAYFKWTGLGELIAVSGSVFLQDTGFTGMPLAVAFIITVAVLNIFMTSGSAQWALMAPIFVPILMMIGFDPAFVQAMFRIGDSVTNIISPMSPYFAVALVNMQRYKPDLGIGTLMATMLPIALGFLFFWTLFLLFWLWMGWPLGPGVYMMSSG